MSELTWILDPATGELTVEGLSGEEAPALVGDLLASGRELNCARPLASLPLPAPTSRTGPTLRVARLYHDSVVDGPGRRSVCQLQGCSHACVGCFVDQTHDVAGGVLLDVDDVVSIMLDPVGEPRDGATITGGEPFLQPKGLLALLERLKAHNVHVVVYTGFTLEALVRRHEPEIREVLELTDILVDGPFVARLADRAGEWRGSRNQRLIARPADGLVLAKADKLA